MSFLSPGFFLFFPVVTLIWFLLPGTARRLWLLCASWWFLLCGGPEHLFTLIAATTFTYCGAQLLDRAQGRRRKVLLVILLIVLFGDLFLVKYLSFSLGLLERVLAAAGLAFSSPALDLILPAGLSFYLFMAAGYLIDVYRRDRPAENSYLDLAIFLSCFPYLLSGPIGRAGSLLPQFRKPAPFCWESFRRGLLRFLWGAFKKLVIADRLGLMVSTVYAAPDSFGRLQVVAAAIAFSVQIYCDFSAYSDMALGCAEVMGFHLMENFRTPYFSRSIGEFWRRWHISLSTWFREYLYIPLGGNRCSKPRWMFNLLVVWAATGIWHGASWNYLIWGLYFFVLLMLEKFFLLKVLNKAPAVVGHIYTLFFVVVSWAIFAIEDFAQLGAYLKVMFGLGGVPLVDAQLGYYVTSYLPILLVAAVASTPLGAKLYHKLKPRAAEVVCTVLVLAGLVVCTAYLVDGTYNPFLYFRF